MLKFSLVAPTIVVAAIAATSPAVAQTMYRCGKSFQDRPCETGSEGKAIGRASSSQAAAAPPAGTADTDCAARGERARKVAWAKEVGRTRDDQLALAKTADERQLISDVYQTRGRSADIATTIEAKCVADKEKAARIAAEAAAMARMQPATAEAVRTPPPSASQNDSATPPSNSENNVSHVRRCQQYRNTIEEIERDQRIGGSGSHMERLRERKKAMESKIADEKCSTGSSFNLR